MKICVGDPEVNQPRDDGAAITAGSSARGIGIQMCVLKEDLTDFDSMVAYMDVVEAGRLILELAQAINAHGSVTGTGLVDRETFLVERCGERGLDHRDVVSETAQDLAKAGS